MGPLRPCQRERAGAELVGELAVQVPRAVVEPSGQPGNTFPVDDAVGDEPHGAADEIGSLVPLR